MNQSRSDVNLFKRKVEPVTNFPMTIHCSLVIKSLTSFELSSRIESAISQRHVAKQPEERPTST